MNAVLQVCNYAWLLVVSVVLLQIRNELRDIREWLEKEDDEYQNLHVQVDALSIMQEEHLKKHSADWLSRT